MSKTTMSDTPRTDHVDKHSLGAVKFAADMTYLARELERELNAAKERIRALEAEKARFIDSVMRVETI